MLAGGARKEDRRRHRDQHGQRQGEVVGPSMDITCTYVQFYMIHRNHIRQEKGTEKPAGSTGIGNLYSGRAYFSVIFERRCIRDLC